MQAGEKRKRKEDDQKQALILGLRDVRERILSLASALPTAKRDQVFLDSWSCRELLAHLAGWDETNLLAASEVLSGSLPGFYAYRDKDWGSFNAMLVEKYRRDDFDDLLRLVRETHGRLLAHLQEVPAQAMWQDYGIRAKGWIVTVGKLLEAERRDEEVHFLQLKEFSEREPG